jgi:hypothetical protein
LILRKSGPIMETFCPTSHGLLSGNETGLIIERIFRADKNM